MKGLPSWEMQLMQPSHIKVRERISPSRWVIRNVILKYAEDKQQDAYTLALILSSRHTTKDNIPRALKAYERARLTRANDVIRLSSDTGRMQQ